MSAKMKMNRCFNCGEEIGAYADYDPLDTCGKPECERAAMSIVREYSENQKPARRYDQDK